MDESTAFTIRTEHDRHYDEKGPSGDEKKTYVMLLDKFRSKLLKDLTPAELKVLLCLALHCNEQMTCWPSLNLIAKETGYSKPTVLKALDDLYERGMVEKTTREKEDGSPDSNLYQIKSPSMLSRGSKKTLPPPQDSGKPDLTTGSKTDDTNVVKPTLPEVEPNFEVKPIEVENTDAISENSNEKPFDAGTDLYWQHCRTAESNQKAGGNHADPPPAGGSDAAAEAGLAALYEAKGSEPPRRHSGGYVQQTEIIAQVLKDCGVIDPEVAHLASLLFVEDKPAMANPYYKSFSGDYADYVGRAKKRASEAAARRARLEADNAEAQAAWEEKRAARPPPPKGDWAWEAAKRELELQADKHTFETWIKHTVGLGRVDGIYTVACANTLARDWLENRLKQTAERTLVGILNESVMVRFEVEA